MKKNNMIELELVDHEEQFEKAKALLKKVSTEFKIHMDLAKKEMDKTYGKDHKFKDEEERQKILYSLLDIPPHRLKALVYIADTVLGVVADLSESRFEVREQLEEQYKMTYLKQPELGKVLFFEHYEKIHEPYDKLKNKCFDLLSKLDPDAVVVETI